MLVVPNNVAITLPFKESFIALFYVKLKGIGIKSQCLKSFESLLHCSSAAALAFSLRSHFGEVGPAKVVSCEGSRRAQDFGLFRVIREICG